MWLLVKNEPGGPRTSSVGEYDTVEVTGSGPRLKTKCQPPTRTAPRSSSVPMLWELWERLWTRRVGISQVNCTTWRLETCGATSEFTQRL